MIPSIRIESGRRHVFDGKNYEDAVSAWIQWTKTINTGSGESMGSLEIVDESAQAYFRATIKGLHEALAWIEAKIAVKETT